MNFEIMQQLPTLEDFIQATPLSAANHEFIRQSRAAIKDILAGRDHRLLLIVGPCSAWPQEAVIEYAHKLKNINHQVRHALLLVMRVYTQKPRTQLGWTGAIRQPDPFAKPDLARGIHYTREMMVKVTNLGIPIADELLFTHSARATQSLLSWVAIGARSSEDQEHRVYASALDCAVGLKNPTHGALAIAANSVMVAQQPHVAAIDGFEVRTAGNPYAHLVLRGSNQRPNYSIKHLRKAQTYLRQRQVSHPAILIDVSHDNSIYAGEKNYARQPEIISEILSSLTNHPALKPLVKGFMLESFLQAGNQRLNTREELVKDGLSITDPCLSWEQTETLLLDLAERHQ